MTRPGTLEKALDALPKVELHCHIEGTLRPATLIELARRHGIALPTTDLAELYRYDSLDGFLRIFWLGQSTLSSGTTGLVSPTKASSMVQPTASCTGSRSSRRRGISPRDRTSRTSSPASTRASPLASPKPEPSTSSLPTWTVRSVRLLVWSSSIDSLSFGAPMHAGWSECSGSGWTRLSLGSTRSPSSRPTSAHGQLGSDYGAPGRELASRRDHLVPRRARR